MGGLLLLEPGTKVLIEQLHPLMQTEGINSAMGLLKHMKTAYGVAGASVTDYSMIAANEALNSPFLLAVIAAGGLANRHGHSCRLDHGFERCSWPRPYRQGIRIFHGPRKNRSSVPGI